jgi:hypothetical protein
VSWAIRRARRAFFGAQRLNGSTAFAQVANDLTDLVGAKGAGGEADLERRGYTHVDISKSSNAAFSYW